LLKLIVMHLDGTFYGIGDSARSGAIEFLDACHRQGAETLFMTNSPL